jgi:putative transcriptional regulator
MSLTTCLKHHFLLAMPGLTADYFGNSITYVAEHNDDGALGFMVNRPLALSLADLLAQLGIETVSGLDGPVLEGGPVKTERGFILHTDDKQFETSVALGNGVMLSTARQTLESIGAQTGPAQYLVALGYAGWEAGQLEREIADNAWLTCPASREVLFEVPFEERVDRAARSLGIDFRLMSSQAGHA